MNLTFHPASEMFPLLSNADLAALAGDIKANSLREPITLHSDGSILDGRNRYRACLSAEVEPRFVDWDGQGTPEVFVISMNLHRRHLSESQRAMIAARLPAFAPGDSESQKHEGEISPSPFTTQQAADLMNVNRATVTSAKTVLKDGTPEEIAFVDSGQSAVNTTAKKIRKRTSKKQSKKKLGNVGKNPERIQKQQINAEIWGRVRDVLTHLTNLPLASDVVGIVRTHEKRKDVVEARLSAAFDWLKEFEHEWNERGVDAS